MAARKWFTVVVRNPEDEAWEEAETAIDQALADLRMKLRQDRDDRAGKGELR